MKILIPMFLECILHAGDVAEWITSPKDMLHTPLLRDMKAVSFRSNIA